MKRITILLLFITILLVLNAQFSFDGPNPNWSPNFSLNGVINPENVKMSHSMSFMSGVSSTGQGYYQSSYTNHIQMKLHQNLKFNIDLSLVNLGSMTHNENLNFSSNNDNTNFVVPAFSLEFRPRENIAIHFEYRQVRGHQFNQNRFWD